MLRTIAILFGLCLATASAEAALLGRAPATPGGTNYQAYYDTTLNISWLTDATLAATETFGVVGVGYGFLPAVMTWYTARNWIAAMNTADYLGVNNWRLPSADVNGDNTVAICSLSSEAQCRDNELGYMFQFNFVRLVTASPFQNLGSSYFWYGTEYAPNTANAWIYNFSVGTEALNDKSFPFNYAWALAPGDPFAVPAPTAGLLFGSALAALGWVRRHRRNQSDIR